MNTLSQAGYTPNKSHTTYYIDVGEHEVYYTFRCEVRNRYGVSSNHICNLSQNGEEAAAKAAAYYEILKDKNLQLNDPNRTISFWDGGAEEPISGKRCPKGISRSQMIAIDLIEDEDLIPIGKHYKTKFTELPDSYILWLAGNYQEKETEFSVDIMNMCAQRALGIALERDLYQKRIDTNLAMKHFGEVGQRLTFSAIVTSVSYESGYYGTTCKVCMKTDDGEFIIYNGTKDLADKGDKLVVKATISKHGINDETKFKYTLIKRPVLVERVPSTQAVD